MRKIVLLLQLSLVVLFTSCATIKVTTIKNSEKLLSDATGYMVFFNTTDMELRKQLESNIVEELKNNGKEAIVSISVFPPLKDYNKEEVKSGCIKNNCNYKITIVTSNTSVETGFVLMYGMLIPASSTNCSFDIIIQDINDNEIVMRSTVNTEGDELKYITKNIAKKIVAEIVNEEVKEIR